MSFEKIDGTLYSQLILAGTANLQVHEEEVNNLNVFPIPDGDTGTNMLLTMSGGKSAVKNEEKNLSEQARLISSGMLLGARGNSGVILSQFFDGISSGFADLKEADIIQVQNAFLEGVKHAYQAVMTPVEGTILTVVKDASDFANNQPNSNLLDYIENFIKEARKSLERTPDLLPVLKKAGVVDSGAAGLIYIMDGMRQFLKGEAVLSQENNSASPIPSIKTLDLDKFSSDSVLEYGYCTEILLRLQNAKCDVETFDVNIIKNYLNTVGNSVVCFKNGSIVKLHVHVMNPDKILNFCQQYGEFLTVKIENMSLQHNNLEINEDVMNDDVFEVPQVKINNDGLKNYGVVAVCNGSGIKKMFLDQGADVIVDGGQSMNPSSEDFISAFDKVNARTIFVFPNNGNVILAAQQAAKLYDKAEIIVIESHTIGEGYTALTMMDTSSGDTLQIEEDLKMSMEGVESYYVSHCVRDAEMDGITMHSGDYISFCGKKILYASKERKNTSIATCDKLNFSDHEVCILIRGLDSTEYEAKEIKNYIMSKYPSVEVYEIDGGQDIYSYIFILE